MKKILIISATEKETNLLKQKLQDVTNVNAWTFSGKFNSLDIDLLIGGVGIPAIVYRLTRKLSEQHYDLVINMGIAGSFSEKIRNGDVVNVTKECFADIGIDDNGQFKNIFEMGFLDKNTPPFVNGSLNNPFAFKKFEIFSKIPNVTGITVNTTSGSEDSIVNRWIKYQPDIESMEGAAVFYVCLQAKTPFIELRSISNKVEPRDIKKWDIPQAIMSLTNHVMYLLSEINAKE